jgi:hypothetical protein
MQFRALAIFAALVIAVTAAPAEVVARQAEDTAVAAPELDARTVTQGVSLKDLQHWFQQIETQT